VYESGVVRWFKNIVNSWWLYFPVLCCKSVCS